MTDDTPELAPDIPPKTTTTPDALLWKQVDELSHLKNSLLELQGELFDTVEAMRKRRLSLADTALLTDKEKEYWRVNQKVQELSAREDEIQKALLEWEAGTLTNEQLSKLVPEDNNEDSRLSKKKQRIRQEKEKLGIDPREMEWDLYLAGPQTTHLTTGRNLKRVSGNFDPFSAASEFYYHTADTHGGKVSYGKTGTSYQNAKGKVVRKR